MTCREKLTIEMPLCVNSDHLGGCYGCPHNYGYLPESMDLCKNGYQQSYLNCRKCWDQEIPGTEKAKVDIYTIELTRDEIATLANALALYMKDTRTEIADILKNYSFDPSRIDILKKRTDTFESIINKFKAIKEDEK